MAATMNWFSHGVNKTKRLTKVLLGRDLLQGTQLACPTERHGSAYGGWVVCPQGLDENSTIYSFGVGKDISFDLSLIAQYGVTVFAFDPTPRSIAWVQAQDVPSPFRFHEIGIAERDGTAHFAAPERADHVSFSISEDRATGNTIEARVHRLNTIAQMLGHHHIDVLKMDIEGAEYAVIADLPHADVTVNQILVEFHHGFHGLSVHQTREAITTLNRLGYRIFSISPNGREYSFIQSHAHSHHS